MLGPLQAVIATVLVGLHHALVAVPGLSPAGGTAWVLAIVLLTAGVRLLLLPLSLRQAKTQSRLRVPVERRAAAARTAVLVA